MTVMPYLGSGSSTESPPRRKAPAARVTSAPPRSTSPNKSNGSPSRGHPTRLRANSGVADVTRSEEHTSELQSRLHLVCRLLLEKKKKKTMTEHQEQNTT